VRSVSLRLSLVHRRRAAAKADCPVASCSRTDEVQHLVTVVDGIWRTAFEFGALGRCPPTTSSAAPASAGWTGRKSRSKGEAGL
jgi:hypothetical protein